MRKGGERWREDEGGRGREGRDLDMRLCMRVSVCGKRSVPQRDECT